MTTKYLLSALFCLFILTPALVLAQTDDSVTQACPSGTPSGTICIRNPLGQFGVSTPRDLIIKSIRGFVAIMGSVAVAFTVFSGFKLIIASNEEAIKSAKDGITWSVGGFALSVLAFTIISGAAALLGYRPTAPTDTLSPCGFLNVGQCTLSRDFTSVVNFLMISILELVAVVAVVMIIYYGYRYAAASGNEEGIAAAKTGLKWALAGLVIVMLAYALIAGAQKLLFGL